MVSRVVLLLSCVLAFAGHAQRYVYIEDVPDYLWHAGCFGTGTGNLAGYWDRNGFPKFYTGPTGGGIAPLSSGGANEGIQSLWASEAGKDGRPFGVPGHMDDYWVDYESPAPDPFTTAGRAEHVPDCIGDFIGLNQRKWTGELMNGECLGNVDAYSFVYWDKTGKRRLNYTPINSLGLPQADIQSGLRKWAEWRGYKADVFTQLMDHESPQPGQGFTYEDLKTEIEKGYPILIFLQDRTQFSRQIGGSPFNPEIHAVLAYGYIENAEELGINKGVVIRTSWGSGPHIMQEWGTVWYDINTSLSPRGVIGFRPKPQITNFTQSENGVSISWDGPTGKLFDAVSEQRRDLHRYQVERATTLNPPNFVAVGAETTGREVTVPNTGTAFYRIRLIN